MSAVRQAWARLLSVFNRRSLDCEFDAEVQSHIALATEDYLRQGLSHPEALRRARIGFGSRDASKDAQRESRGMPWVEGLFHDLKFAVRALWRDRAFTFTAIVMLAIAIGLNGAAFTLMNTMLFRGFPLVRANDRLLYMQERFPSGLCCISYPDFETWQTQSHSFEGMGFLGGKRLTLNYDGGRSLDLTTAVVSSNTFGLLGVKPILGRDFLPADEAPGAPPVAILSYDFWQNTFGGDRDVAGLAVRVDKFPATIIGVMPEGFGFPEQQDLWMPLVDTPQLHERAPGSHMAFGRLRNGVSQGSARAELALIDRRLEAAWPATNRGVVPRVDIFAQFFVGPDATIIYGSLWAAAWGVFLIACANLTNLTLARTVGRSREFSTRLALGAGRGRIVRQLLTESFLVAGIAGAIAWLLTRWSVRAWAVATASHFQVLDFRTGPSILAWVAALSLAAAILCAAAPIGIAFDHAPNSALEGNVRGMTQSVKGKRVARLLVAGQTALAIVLLSGAGVLVRSLANVLGAQTGVRDPEHVLVGYVRLPSARYAKPADRQACLQRLQSQLEMIQGIESQSLSSTIPVGSGDLRSFEIEGRPGAPNGGDAAQFISGSVDYFHVLGADPISGRAFDSGDRESSSPVAIVNQSFAERFWPGQQSIGKRIRSQGPDGLSVWRTVVGVVPNIMQGEPTRQRFKPVVYVPFLQTPNQAAFFLLRTSVPPGQVAQSVQAAAHRLDPDASLEDVVSLKEYFGFRRDRMDIEHAEMGKHAAVAPLFALTAMLLAAVGLYATIAHAMSQRTKEIGLRLAIGANARDIRRMVLREGMLPVLLGLSLGLPGSLAMNRILRSQLVAVSPWDPITLAGAALLLTVVALLACGIPARRAMRVDPAVALRHE